MTNGVFILMITEELSAAAKNKVVGLNQTKKAISSGTAKKVYIAGDADDMFSTELKKLCGEYSIPVIEVPTMAELGEACGIDVGCAVCAIIG